MSDNMPSWLREENLATAAAVASNPAVQKAAQNPAVQKAALSAATAAANQPPVAPVAAKSSGFNPSWAQDDYKPPTVPGVYSSHDPESGAAPTPQPTASVALNLTSEEETILRTWHNRLRVAYMLAAIVMGVAAGLSLVSQTNVGKIFFALYILLFCLLMCCHEVSLRAVMRIISINFGFLYTVCGRITFVLFLGFMSFSLTVFGKIAMAILYAVLLLHVYVMFRHPNFEAYVRQKHFNQKE